MNLNSVQITSCVLTQMLRYRTDIFQTWFYCFSLEQIKLKFSALLIVTVNTVTPFGVHLLGLN